MRQFCSGQLLGAGDTRPGELAIAVSENAPRSRAMSPVQPQTAMQSPTTVAYTYTYTRTAVQCTLVYSTRVRRSTYMLHVLTTEGTLKVKPLLR